MPLRKNILLFFSARRARVARVLFFLFFFQLGKNKRKPRDYVLYRQPRKCGQKRKTNSYILLVS